MKKLLLVLLFFPLVSFGQTKDAMEICLAFQSRSFYSDSEAEKALGEILSVTGLKKNFILTPCDGVENATAISVKGERYIFYNKNFMKNIGGSSSNIAILAHEVGHHLNNHARDITMYVGGVIEPDSKEVSRGQELEADEFAGFVMGRLGYSLNEAKQPFYRISNNNDDSYSTHPSRDKRLASITKGYNNGKVVTKEKTVYVTKEIPVTKEKIVYVTKEKGDNEVNESVKNKIERNWYKPRFAPILGIGDDVLIGLKFSLDNFYIDFKGTFGGGIDEPSDYRDEINYEPYGSTIMNATFVESTTDESEAIYVINVGYIFPPLIKTKNYNFSISIGPGVAFVKEARYDRYTSSNGKNIYSKYNTNMPNLNLNIGFEIAYRSGFGLVSGFDSYNKAPFFGINLSF